VCESLDHFVAQCSNHKDKKSANMNISEVGGTSGYNILFPTIISIFYSPELWIDTGANIHVCADISLFSSY
jgi:hypothetical protein